MGQRLIVTLPDIGEGVVEGEVIEWLKQVGDSLKQDEPVVIVMTDKATVELPAPQPGKLAKQHYQPGQVAIKDKPLYEIELASETSLQSTPTSQEASPPATSGIDNGSPEERSKARIKPSPNKKPERTESTPCSKANAIPQVRHLAKELGIDIDKIQGSGKEGRVTLADLHSRGTKAAVQVAATPVLRLADDEEIPLIGIKQLMAKKMAESKAQIPHFSYFETADVTRLVQLRKSVRRQAAEEGLHVTYMPFIIKALSLCINAHPILNSSCDMENGTIRVHRQHHIGIAMKTPLGLIVPVLKNVQSMNIEQVIHAYDALIERAQKSKLLPSDMKESTITVSNFGTGGHGLWATPIINYPEAAIVAIAKIQQQPMVKNGQVAVRDAMNVSWSFDHRIIDGDLAVQISDRFCQLLQNPAPLL